MIKNIKNQSDYFFPELPKWITHYGLGVMILLLISFLTAASLIQYSDIQHVDIILKKNQQLARLDFKVYNMLKNNQPVLITGPFAKPVHGYLKKEIVAAKDNYVTVPAVITDSAVLRLPIDGELKCQGSFKISKGSLLWNLISK